MTPKGNGSFKAALSQSMVQADGEAKMAYFRLKPRSRRDRPRGDFITKGNQLTSSSNLPSNARLLLRGRTSSATRTAGSPNERIFIQTGTKMQLQQVGNTGTAGEMPVLDSNKRTVASISNVTRAATGDKQTFTLHANAPGKAELFGRKPHTSVDCVVRLTVEVGDFKPDPGMEHDLIAEKLGKSKDPYMLYYLQRILNNNADNTNLFYQKSNWYKAFGAKFGKAYVCASVCVLSGEVLFGQVHAARPKWNNKGPHNPLYKRPFRKRPPEVRETDVEYVKDLVKKAGNAIASSLKAGIPVRVGCAHHPLSAYRKHPTDPKKDTIDPTKGGGHSVLIVGCNAAQDKFLYLDPWWGGSNFEYKGGIRPAGTKCEFLGLLTMDSSQPRGLVLKQDPCSYGSFDATGYLEVVAAPTKPVS